MAPEYLWDCSVTVLSFTVVFTLLAEFSFPDLAAYIALFLVLMIFFSETYFLPEGGIGWFEDMETFALFFITDFYYITF